MSVHLCGSSHFFEKLEELRRAHEEFITSELYAKVVSEPIKHKRPRVRIISPDTIVRVHVLNSFVVMTYREYKEHGEGFQMEIML